jgi:hypothetical protein
MVESGFDTYRELPQSAATAIPAPAPQGDRRTAEVSLSHMEQDLAIIKWLAVAQVILGGILVARLCWV